MPVLIKIAAKAGWNAVNKYYSKVMQLIGQGWSVDQISKWLSNH
ncbi:enterocin L50 family leaderless bacteriocin [Weissella confusa]|nr:enterocin L50 family leaderless bacteriocin [Weissella confusa]